MTGLQNRDIVLAAYQDKRTVFRLKDIAMLTGETNFESINKKLNYLVRAGKFLNPRKGIYAKAGFSKEELACNLYTPAYISLEYVLQKAGVVFQYDPAITCVSYLSRTTIIDGQAYVFRKIKSQILTNTNGVERRDNQINMATAERAFLDMLYLNTSYHFDNLTPLNIDAINNLLPLYNSKVLNVRTKKVLSNAV